MADSPKQSGPDYSWILVAIILAPAVLVFWPALIPIGIIYAMGIHSSNKKLRGE